MAQAPGHLLGQTIGKVMEEAVQPRLKRLADRHGLYLDAMGDRPGVRPGRKVTWTDAQGNGHDLDFVLERGGAASLQGTPAAFVECAWRRYTKHSKAKAQEISGALDPLLLTHANARPVGSAVVAGEWSRPALTQLRSNGYLVLHVEFETVRSVFAEHGIDIAGQGEGTADSYWLAQCEEYDRLSNKSQLAVDFQAAIKSKLDGFISDLEKRIVRKVQKVQVLPLYGRSLIYDSVAEAIAEVTVSDSLEVGGTQRFVRFEVTISWDNGDFVRNDFESVSAVAAFLRTFG